MTFTEFASMMYPFWILGVLVIGAVITAGQKHLLRVKKAPLVEWISWLVFITAIRFLMYKMSPQFFISHSQAANIIPIGTVFTVFWEDAVHGLPLLILGNVIGNRKWLKPLYYLIMLCVMVEFGCGHLYQGIGPAILLSFYIPVSINIAKKHGFGTVMIGHILYDLVSLVFIKYLVGL